MVRHNIAGLILAGGRSSRMGIVKPLQDLEGKPVIQWGVEAFRNAGVKDIYVVLGFHSEKIFSILKPLNVRIIINTMPERGMFSSVQAGLQAFSSDVDGFFLLPADMPMIRSQTVKRLLEGCDHSHNSVIYPVYLGERGHPPLIMRRCFQSILSVEPEGNLRDVLHRFEWDSREVECADSGILMDMDTPEDYKVMKTHCENKAIPTEGECATLLKLYGTPESVICHGRAVAGVASEIAGRLNREANLGLNIPLLYAASLLHDIARCEPNHGQVGADIVAEEGFSALSESIAVHMNLQLPMGEFEIGCKEILYLSDKMVEEDRFIPLEQRFSNAVLGKSSVAAVPEKVAARLLTAQRIKIKIENILGLEDLYTALYLQAQ